MKKMKCNKFNSNFVLLLSTRGSHKTIWNEHVTIGIMCVSCDIAKCLYNMHDYCLIPSHSLMIEYSSMKECMDYF